MPPDPLPVMTFESTDAWDTWLAAHHADSPGLWLKIAKKGAAGRTVSYSDALDVALCHGWIDGQAKSLDERHYLQRFTPRRATSIWSKINRDRVSRLIADGRMHPAGLAEVARAKADGRWAAAYDSPKTAVVPDDLSRALAKRPKAKAAFAKLDAANRYANLHRLHNAKRVETRVRRIETFVTMLEASKTVHPVKKKRAPSRSDRKRRT